jgi:hypothetical protein
MGCCQSDDYEGEFIDQLTYIQTTYIVKREDIDELLNKYNKIEINSTKNCYFMFDIQKIITDFNNINFKQY